MLRVCPLWGEAGRGSQPAQPAHRGKECQKRELDLGRARCDAQSLGGLRWAGPDSREVTQFHRWGNGGDDEGSDETCLGRKGICNGLGACRRALSCGLQSPISNPSIFQPYSQNSKGLTDCMLLWYGSRVASCGSFLSCLQRHYSNGKSVQQHPLLLFSVRCGAGAASAGAGAGCRCCCWAGLQWRLCERTDSNCSLALPAGPLFPSPLRPLRKSEGGSAPRSLGACRLSPSCRLSRGLFEHSPAFGPSPFCLRREARGYLQSARAQVGILCPATFRSLDARTKSHNKRGGRLSRAEPSLEVQTPLYLRSLVL